MWHRLVSACALSALLATTRTAFAIVLASGATNTSPPTGDPGFYNVGQVAGSVATASGVYVGNGWVLTADHVGVGPTTLQGTTYSVDTSVSPVHFVFPYYTPSTAPDLVMFKVTGNPGLSSLPIATTVASPGDRLLMMGSGLINDGMGTRYYHFDASSTPPWTTQSPPTTPVRFQDFAGFSFASGTGTRWGENIVDGEFDVPIGVTGFYGASVRAEFNHSQYEPGIRSILTDEAIVAAGDSGGAGFINSKLSGIILGVYPGTTSKPTGNPVLYGDASVLTQLAPLRRQIIDITHTERTGDFNGDGKVNAADLDILGADIGNATPNYFTEDFNLDQAVNQDDFEHLIGALVDINDGGAAGSHGTHYGDVNLDGVVNQTDTNLLVANFGSSGMGWADGNLNGYNNTVVNQSDVNLLVANFGQSGPDIALVPEPSTFALLALGALGICLHRKRQLN